MILYVGLFLIVSVNFTLCQILCDGKYQLGSNFTDAKGCFCECIKLGNKGVSLCKCQPPKPLLTTERPTRCQYDGQIYQLDESWMSSTKNCTTCQCKSSGKVVCSHMKHCMRSCEVGQHQTFGFCCESQCSGQTNYSMSQDALTSLQCTDIHTGTVVKHGKVFYKRGKCLDLMCHCAFKEVRCFHYCPIFTLRSPESFSDNNNSTINKSPVQYWNKFCCPRIKGNTQCVDKMGRHHEPGRQVLLNGHNCTCLDARFYCDNDDSTDEDFSLHTTTTLTSPSFIQSTIKPSHHSKIISVIVPITVLMALVMLIVTVFICQYYRNKKQQRLHHKTNLKLMIYNNHQNTDDSGSQHNKSDSIKLLLNQ